MPDSELLLALDMFQAGRSEREIGKALRKKTRIAKRTWPDSALRALARRRIEKGQWMMAEGYLELAAGR